MKSVRSIAALAILSTVAFTSCRKDYSCTCTTTAAGVTTTTVFEHDFRNRTKVNADENCQKKEVYYNNSTAGVTHCKI